MLLIAPRELDLPGPERGILCRASFHSHNGKILLLYPNPSLHQIFFGLIGSHGDEETWVAFLLFGTEQLEFVVVWRDSGLVSVFVLRGILLGLDQFIDDLAANVIGSTLRNGFELLLTRVYVLFPDGHLGVFAESF